MPRSLVAVFLTATLLIAGGEVRAEDAPKVNFTDHVLPIFRAKCNSCHDAGNAKGGLVLDNYAATMNGGASGAVIEEGLDDSRLWALVTHAEQPIMPPQGGKLPDNELALIKQWIEGGVLETAASMPRKAKKKSFALGTVMISNDKPEGPPPFPENLSTEPLVLSSRGNAVTALAASPWAPLLAVAGHRQVILYDLRDNTVAAVFPFPEGTIHVLRFSRNGSLLLAAGGRGGQSGKAIVFDVKTGARMSEVGNEPDAILAADLSPNHGMVAVGGPKKLVRVYDTSNGELLFEMKKHTDWVTAIEFSPDGVLLASGDRSNGLFVWEANTGREFYNLAGHAGTVTQVSWRLDSNVLASTSEDSTVRLWEMNGGSQIKSWGAHGGGSQSVWFLRDGRLVSTGRDRVTKLWDQNGAQQVAFAATADVALKATFSETNGTVYAGDWTGLVTGWNATGGAEVVKFATNPVALDARLQAATAEFGAANTAATNVAAQLAALQKVLADKKLAAETALKVSTDAAKAAEVATAAKAEADKQVVAREEIRKQGEAVLAGVAMTAEKAKAAKALVDGAADKTAQAAVTEALAAVEKASAAAKAAYDAQVAEKAKANQAVVDTTAKLKAATDQAAVLKAAADKAVAEMNPTPDETKQLEAYVAQVQQTAAVAAAKKAIVDKLTAEKGRPAVAVQPLAAK